MNKGKELCQCGHPKAGHFNDKGQPVICYQRGCGCKQFRLDKKLTAEYQKNKGKFGLPAPPRRPPGHRR